MLRRFDMEIASRSPKDRIVGDDIAFEVTFGGGVAQVYDANDRQW